MSIRRWWMLLIVVTTGCAQGGGPDIDAAAQDLTDVGGAGGQGGESSSSSTSSSSSSGVGGADGSTCAPGEKICGGICKQVTTDPDHCGDCFNGCANDADCVGGLCTAGDPGGTGGSGGGDGGCGGGGTNAICAPLAPELVCGPASRCTPQPNGSPICVGPTGPGSQYAYCTQSGQCDATHECVATGTYAFCLQWCTTDVDCPNWYDQCHPIEPAAYVGGQAWGVCHNGVS